MLVTFARVTIYHQLKVNDESFKLSSFIGDATQFDRKNISKTENSNSTEKIFQKHKLNLSMTLLLPLVCACLPAYDKVTTFSQTNNQKKKKGNQDPRKPQTEKI